MRQRLDLELVQRGFVDSRAKAQGLILSGQVRVGTITTTKAGAQVSNRDAITVDEPLRFVSRGGLKLEKALTEFAVNPNGKTCLDVGSSTGGFTDCLLQNGAVKVYAVDSGTNQLHWKLRSDSRVDVREKTNARLLTRSDFNQSISLAVMDVSFISIRLLLPMLKEVLDECADIVSLIKPQFEGKREWIGRGGIVRDPLHHVSILETLEAQSAELEWYWTGLIYSPITGRDGNIEYLAKMSRNPAGRISSAQTAELAALAFQVLSSSVSAAK